MLEIGVNLEDLYTRNVIELPLEVYYNDMRLNT